MYKKFRQLFVPWLVFSVFNIVLSQILSFNTHAGLMEELKWNFLQIRGHGDQIWFVAALFVAFIPFYFFIQWYGSVVQKSVKRGGVINKCVRAIVLAWFLSFVSVLLPKGTFPWNSTSLPWHIEYMFQAMFYMVLGYVFRYNIENWFDKHNTKRLRTFALIGYLLLVYIPFFGKIELVTVADIMYRYISSVLGIGTLIMIAKHIKTNKYINYVGQNTLIYFALHGKALSIIQTLMKKVAASFYSSVMNNTIISSVFCLGFSIVLSIILIVPAYIINRWFPFIVGREKRKGKINESSPR